MSKRFTDTDKWKKKFIRDLNAPYKLLWLYIIDDCDHAGIWHVDIEVATIRTGQTFDENIAIQKFGDKIIPIDNGEKWFIPSFIEFQYGKLNETNRAHNSVLRILEKYNLLEKDKGLVKGLTSTMEADKDKDMVKDMDMVKDKDKEEDEIKKPNPMDEIDDDKKEILECWIKYRKELKKPIKVESTVKALVKLFNSEHIEKISQVVNLSIENGWQGLIWDKYDPKTKLIEVDTVETIYYKCNDDQTTRSCKNREEFEKLKKNQAGGGYHLKEVAKPKNR